MEELLNAIRTIIKLGEQMSGNTPTSPIPQNEVFPQQYYTKDQNNYFVNYPGGTTQQIQRYQVPKQELYSLGQISQQTMTPAQEFSYYTRGQVPQGLSGIISQAAKQHGIHPSLLAAMLFQESGINPNTKDNVNIDPATGQVISRDRGIAQINDRAHPEISDSQARDPSFAIPFMAKQLSGAFKEKQSWPQAIASYNVGRGRVGYDDSRDEYGLGPFGRNYVSGIRKNLDPNYASQIGLPDYKQARR